MNVASKSDIVFSKPYQHFYFVIGIGQFSGCVLRAQLRWFRCWSQRILIVALIVLPFAFYLSLTLLCNTGCLFVSRIGPDFVKFPHSLFPLSTFSALFRAVRLLVLRAAVAPCFCSNDFVHIDGVSSVIDQWVWVWADRWRVVCMMSPVCFTV